MSDVVLQNIDAEEGVLGGILLDPSAISIVANNSIVCLTSLLPFSLGWRETPQPRRVSSWH